MDESKLEQELREKLPPKELRIDTEKCIAHYYDYHGVTFCETHEELKVINQYVADAISDKLGYKVVITEKHHSGNGHMHAYFEKADK